MSTIQWRREKREAGRNSLKTFRSPWDMRSCAGGLHENSIATFSASCDGSFEVDSDRIQIMVEDNSLLYGFCLIKPLSVIVSWISARISTGLQCRRSCMWSRSLKNSSGEAIQFHTISSLLRFATGLLISAPAYLRPFTPLTVCTRVGAPIFLT